MRKRQKHWVRGYVRVRHRRPEHVRAHLRPKN
jgi:hypothetical protein